MPMTATTTTRYAIRRVVELPYDVALDRIRTELQNRGFGILWDIDIREKLKEKIGADFKRYIILGACNPPLAHRALQAESDVGLLLPCNVIVYEEGPARSVVAALDPNSMVTFTGNAALEPVAREARERLEAAIAALG